MKNTQPNFQNNQTNGTVQYRGPKLKNGNFSQETQKLKWQLRPINQALKIWYVSVIGIHIPIKHEKVNIFYLNNIMNSNPKMQSLEKCHFKPMQRYN